MAKEKIYGLNARDAKLVKDTVLDWGRFPRSVAPPVSNSTVRDNSHRILFRNDSGEDIPPGAIMRKTGVELLDAGYLVYTMDKPATSEFKPPFYVNFQSWIADGEEGYCSTFEHEAGLGYYISGTVTAGDSWGPKGGQWNLERYYPGFEVLGNEDNGQVYVVQRVPGKVLAMSDSGGVPARSSTTMGSDNGVVIHCRNGATVTATTFVITAYNEAAEAVQGSTYLQLAYIQGGWVVDWEECPPA